jgi:pantoate--beta-alanine ligase
MIVYKDIEGLKEALIREKAEKHTIGFVPTMGFFHEGHLSLMKEAKTKTDVVVVSIFVNPTQFGPNEDFEAYPRDLERDLDLCGSVGVDYVFAPDVKEMYPDGYATYVSVESQMTAKLCGASRPGHFKGVTSVVNKLFNIVTPDFAFFGQKDAQQVAVLEKMVRDLNMNLKIVACPIVREADGLAMSSRNVYLSPSERKDALVLSQSLELAYKMIQNGEKNADRIIEAMKKNIESVESAAIDYVEIVDLESLEKLSMLNNRYLIALAVRIGKTRLIDNMRIEQ